MARRLNATLCLVVCLGVVGGCRTLQPESPEASPLLTKEKSERPAILPWKEGSPKKGAPNQIVATWTDTVLQEAGKGATRGFGGRLYFYGNKDTRPIAVEGQLVVYAFDETDRKPTDNKPNRRYVFPPEQFSLHESESELGVSYSFWLPWSAVGGVQKDVSLIARFEPLKGGALVVSDQSKVRLPGQFAGPKVASKKTTTKRRITSVQQASHESPVTTAAKQGTGSEPPAALERVQTTTIPLPKNHQILRRPVEKPARIRPQAGPWQTKVSVPVPAGSTPSR